MFLRSSPLVQQTQVRLPADRNHTSEDTPVLYGDIGETERRYDGPQLAAINPACRHGMLDTCYDFVEGSAREQRLHAKEVRVEDWREENLIDNNLTDKLALEYP
jgi:hypothetical protein